MSSTYAVIAGDTFDLIARKKYGTEAEAGRIARANPGVVEPLTAGTEITVPALPGAPRNKLANARANAPGEVAILIEGQRFRFWDRVSIVRSLDSVDAVEFGAPFDPDTPGFRETFRPFSFKPLEITVGGDPLFTGTLVGVTPSVEDSRRTVAVSGYSLPGVLQDCTAPASSYPLEFDGQGLQQIAATLTAPFGIDVQFDADPGAIFERVAIEPTKTVLSFLTDLAKQRNLVISSTARGLLQFSQSVATGNPVARLRQGSAPVLSVTPAFSPQSYYSHITGVEPAGVGLDGAQFTVKNPRLAGVIRPHTFNIPDTLTADLSAAASAKMGRMFGNAAAYSVPVATWRDPQGAIWAPNTTVTLVAPGAMVYNEYEFVIRSIRFEREGRSETAILNLVIPGAFSGGIPEALPWDA